jgi:hypothetical protein
MRRELPKNFAPGGFSDRYDNERSRSVDRDQNLGGITHTHFEDEIDLLSHDYFPNHGEAYTDQFDAEASEELDLDQGGGAFLSYRGLGPRGWKKTDERLYQDVCHALEQSREVDASGLEVVVSDGVVTLRGQLPSRGMKVIAVDLVESVPGVMDVFTEVRTRS